jgi:hypothetical protein
MLAQQPGPPLRLGQQQEVPDAYADTFNLLAQQPQLLPTALGVLPPELHMRALHVAALAQQPGQAPAPQPAAPQATGGMAALQLLQQVRTG